SPAGISTYFVHKPRTGSAAPKGYGRCRTAAGASDPSRIAGRHAPEAGQQFCEAKLLPAPAASRRHRANRINQCESLTRYSPEGTVPPVSAKLTPYVVYYACLYSTSAIIQMD